MKNLVAIAVATAALVLLAGASARAQGTPNPKVNVGCCGKICLAPAAGCYAPVHTTSRRCVSAYNTTADTPPIMGSPAGGGGCVEADTPVLNCVGGGGTNSLSFSGCGCISGFCGNQTGILSGSACTKAAVDGCRMGNVTKDQADDPDCSLCPSPPSP